MIDPDGYRPNVGIVLMHPDGRVFWARRVRRDGWQFPQGGMNSDETPLEAMYRELGGNRPAARACRRAGVTPAGCATGCRRAPSAATNALVCIGQKQVWFLLQFTGAEADLRLDQTDHPEFDQWRWVDFWYPAENVVLFKRDVYRSALRHLAPFARQIAGRRRSRRRCPPAARGAAAPPACSPGAPAPARGGFRVVRSQLKWFSFVVEWPSSTVLGPPVYVCICNGITDRQIREVAAAGCRSVAELTMRTGAGAGCGSCA